MFQFNVGKDLQQEIKRKKKDHTTLFFTFQVNYMWEKTYNKKLKEVKDHTTFSSIFQVN